MARSVLVLLTLASLLAVPGALAEPRVEPLVAHFDTECDGTFRQEPEHPYNYTTWSNVTCRQRDDHHGVRVMDGDEEVARASVGNYEDREERETYRAHADYAGRTCSWGVNCYDSWSSTDRERSSSRHTTQAPVVWTSATGPVEVMWCDERSYAHDNATYDRASEDTVLVERDDRYVGNASSTTSCKYGVRTAAAQEGVVHCDERTDTSYRMRDRLVDGRLEQESEGTYAHSRTCLVGAWRNATVDDAGPLSGTNAGLRSGYEERRYDCYPGPCPGSGAFLTARAWARVAGQDARVDEEAPVDLGTRLFP